MIPKTKKNEGFKTLVENLVKKEVKKQKLNENSNYYSVLKQLRNNIDSLDKFIQLFLLLEEHQQIQIEKVNIAFHDDIKPQSTIYIKPISNDYKIKLENSDFISKHKNKYDVEVLNKMIQISMK